MKSSIAYSYSFVFVSQCFPALLDWHDREALHHQGNTTRPAGRSHCRRRQNFAEIGFDTEGGFSCILRKMQSIHASIRLFIPAFTGTETSKVNQSHS